MRTLASRTVPLALGLCLVIVLGACGGDDKDDKDSGAKTTNTATSTTASSTTTVPTTTSSTTTASTTTASTTTTAPTTSTTTTTTTPAAVTSPEAAAQGLYDAWKDGDKGAAAAVAEAAAVDTMFARPYSGPDPSFAGCSPDGAEYACTYLYEGGARTFRVGGDATTGYRVLVVVDIAD